MIPAQYSFTYLEDTDSYSISCSNISDNPDEAIIPSTGDDGEHGERPVTAIESEAFLECTYLESVTIPASVTSIGYQAFEWCDSLTSVNITDIAKWCEISFDGGGANPLSYAHNLYLNNELVTALLIPDGVASIGNYAFYNCNSLTNINIPSSVTSIGNYAFYNCNSLTSITVAEGNTVYHSAGNCLVETTSKTLILGCKNSVIPTDGSVTSIGDSAFYSCRYLAIINIPSSVTSIGERAFGSCRSLTSIDIPTSVTSIGDYAFQGCSSLTSVNIPASVTSIGNQVFYNCTSLTSINISEGVTSIGTAMFQSCRSLTSVAIPTSVTSIGINAFIGCVSLTSVTVLAKTPPSLSTSIAFSNKYPIYVPADSIDTYKIATNWTALATRIQPMPYIDFENLYNYNEKIKNYISDRTYTKTQTSSLLASKLTEPSSGIAIGKIFKVASIDTDGHPVLEYAEPAIKLAQSTDLTPTSQTVTLTKNTRYAFGTLTDLTATFPSTADDGDEIIVEFVSGPTATTLTLDNVNAIYNFSSINADKFVELNAQYKVSIQKWVVYSAETDYTAV